MNLKRVKQKWYLAKIISLVGAAVWVIETAYFLIAYGWHLKAINDNEKICDNIVVYIWAVSLFIGIKVMIDIIEYLLSESSSS